MATPPLNPIVFDSLRGGQNDTDPLPSLAADECEVSTNVEFFVSALGERRAGCDPIDVSQAGFNGMANLTVTAPSSTSWGVIGLTLAPAGVIAFDSSANGGFNVNVNSYTAAYVVGTANYLLVGVVGDSTVDKVTGVTFNGVAMTQLKKYQSTIGWLYTYGLAAPASGSHNVVISASGNCTTLGFLAASYNNVSSSEPDSSVTASAAGVASVTTQFTPVANSAWAVQFSFDLQGQSTSMTGGSPRAFGVITSAAPTLSWTGTSSGSQNYNSVTTPLVFNPGTYTLTVNSGSLGLTFKGVAGGGGGATAAGTAGSTGGGGGETTRGVSVTLVSGKSYTLTIGAGGVAGATGGTTSLVNTTDSVTMVSLVGGSGGVYTAGSNTPSGGVGGTGGIGTNRIAGGPGGGSPGTGAGLTPGSVANGAAGGGGSGSNGSDGGSGGAGSDPGGSGGHNAAGGNSSGTGGGPGVGPTGNNVSGGGGGGGGAIFGVSGDLANGAGGGGGAGGGRGSTTATANFEAVGGGASGGYSGSGSIGGGGGAGQVLVSSSTVSAGTYAVVVAASVAGVSPGNSGNNGNVSTVFGATAVGGGGGGANGSNGNNGACGGGGDDITGGGGGGTVGGNGGAGNGNSSGGGGGMGGPGAGGNFNAAGGQGGAGVASSVPGSGARYAGGGGGNGNGKGFGQDGGGDGGAGGNPATDAAANSGAGGGGGQTAVNNVSGAGGSGRVTIWYLTGTMTATGGMITTSGAYTIHTFTSNGNFVVTISSANGAGGAGGAGLGALLFQAANFSATLGDTNGPVLSQSAVTHLSEWFPLNDDVTSELWAIGAIPNDSTSAKVSRYSPVPTGTPVWYTVNPVDPIVTSSPAIYSIHSQALDGLLYWAYTSGVDRLHVWEPSTQTLRRTGLAQPGAPSPTNGGGGGTYAATKRWYRIRLIEQSGTTIVRRSEPSTSASITPDGSHLNVTVTLGTLVGEGETHWELEVSLDNITFYRLATTVIGTTTYADSAATTTYSSNPLSDAIGSYLLQAAAEFIGTDADHLILAGHTFDPARASTVWWSPIGGDPGVGNGERQPIVTTGGTAIVTNLVLDNYVGGGITGIATGFTQPVAYTTSAPVTAFFVFKWERIYLLTSTGNAAQAYSAICLSSSNGALPGSAFKGVDEKGRPAVYFLDPMLGPSRVTMTGGIEVLKGLRTTWKRVNINAQDVASCGCYYPFKRQALWWVAVDGGNVPGLRIKYQVFDAQEAEGGRGWSLDTGRIAQARCTTTYTEFVQDGTSITLSRRPIIGLTAPDFIQRCDVNSTDAGVPFVATVRSGPRAPQSPIEKCGVSAGQVTVSAQAGVTVQIRVTRDYGVQTSVPQTVSATPAGSESLVITELDALSLSECHVVQVSASDV